jgi:hypothetical protein
MRQRLFGILSAIALCLGMTVTTAPAAMAAAYCGQTWGSQAKGGGTANDMKLVAIRTGQHACFDRLVLQFDEPLQGWAVSYPDTPLLQREHGGASLRVRAFTKTPPFLLALTGRRVATVTGYRTFRDVRSTALDTTDIQVDVRGRLPFRAFVLAGPGGGSRLVVDVGHRWCSPGEAAC